MLPPMARARGVSHELPHAFTQGDATWADIREFGDGLSSPSSVRNLSDLQDETLCLKETYGYELRETFQELSRAEHLDISMLAQVEQVAITRDDDFRACHHGDIPRTYRRRGQRQPREACP
jgi:hypothetical protein